MRAKVEKPKKSDKRSTKSSSNEKKRKAIDTEDDKPKKKRKEKETASPSKPEMTATASSDDRLTKTQKRNRRKAIRRIKQREEQEKLKQQQQQAKQNVIETKRDTATSEHLLKFNKNKRKDFLKVQNKKKREHVRFDGIDVEEEEETPDEITATTYDDQYDAYGYGYAEEEVMDHANLYGAAYVTSVEADQRYKGEKKEGKSYPIDHMADHFYAEAPPSSEEVQEEDVEVTQEISQEEKEVQQQPIQRNYEELPKLGFSGPSIPAVGDLIAFKVHE